MMSDQSADWIEAMVASMLKDERFTTFTTYVTGPNEATVVERSRKPVRRTALLASATVRAFGNGGMKITPEIVQQSRKSLESEQYAADALMKRSADSLAMLDYWDKTDAIVAGLAAMRAQGTMFMPMFTDEEQVDYNYRLKQTKLTNVYRDIVEGLAAKPFEKEIGLDEDENEAIPSEVADFIEDVDGSGNNLTVYAGQLFFNAINSAIHWIFIDHPPANPTIRSVADAKAVGARPYWSHVLGRNVLEARSKVINGKEQLQYIRIYEPGAVDHIRVFIRDEITGVVTWTLYEKKDTEHDIVGIGRTRFHEEDGGTLTIPRIPLVPLITARRDGRTFRLFPAMQDAADLQVDLYQEESALKFAKKLTGYPMLAGQGVKPPLMEDGKTIKKLAIGPARTLYAPPDGTGNHGEWAYVEPSASSLKFLAEDNKDTIQQLRELGRQPLTAQSGNLTVITAAVAAGKARSAVSAWALLMKDALENAMVITCMWLGIAYEPIVQVFTEFDEFAEGKDLDTLNAARTNKDISQETYWDELKRRGVLSDEFDPDEEKKRLLAEAPADDGLDTNPDNNPNNPPVTP